MSACSICTEQLPPEAKSCPVCGTAVESADLASPSLSPNAGILSETELDDAAPGPTSDRSEAGARRCPACRNVFDATYADSFCTCGTELPSIGGSSPGLSSATDGEHVLRPALAPGLLRPPAGTVCLTVFSEEREPIHYHVIDTDVTIVGRSDPLRGDFPDLDLGTMFDDSVAKRVSRKHALVIRSRETRQYVLRPLAKNTGTQIERELTSDLTDYPLTNGTRLVLGGAVRLKFEVIT